MLLYCSPPIIDLIGFFSNLGLTILFKFAMLLETNNIVLILPKTACPSKFGAQSYGPKRLKIGYFWRLISNVKSYQKSDCFNPRSFLYKKYYRQIFCISTSSPWKLSQQIGTEIGSKTVFFPLDHKVLNGYCHHICLSVVVVCLSVCPWRVLGSHISQK